MNTKPILFNTDMVRAILASRKTVTRRVVKKSALDRFVIDDNGELIGSVQVGDAECIVYPSVDDCPYQPGDILYVRERWRIWKAHRYEADAYIEYGVGQDGVINGTILHFPFGSTDSVNRNSYDRFIEKWGIGDKWHPSIHMPREAARIFLQVTDVRVERLQSIGALGIEQEGIRLYDDICRNERWHPSFYDPDSGRTPSLVLGFSKLWDSTIKPSDRTLYGWEANPWVWVIEFERISRKEALA